MIRNACCFLTAQFENTLRLHDKVLERGGGNLHAPMQLAKVAELNCGEECSYYLMYNDVRIEFALELC